MRYYSPGTFIDDRNNHDIAWLPLMVGTDNSAFTPYGPAWLSVDPLSDKFPDISPYAYCNWNPIKYVDPDGKFKIKAGISFAMSTGIGGLGIGKLGGFTITPGDAAQASINIYVMYESKQNKLGIGIEHTTTYKIDNDFLTVKILGISHEEHKERSIINGANTIEGDISNTEQTYNYVENFNFNKISIQDNSKEKKPSANFDVGPEVNVFLTGVEAKININYEP